MNPAKCGGCGDEMSFNFRCSKCERRFCPKCLRVDMATKTDVCQACLAPTKVLPNVAVQNIEVNATGFVVRWKFVDKPGWGELSIFRKADSDMWHIDTEAMTDDTVDAILQSIRKFAVRAG